MGERSKSMINQVIILAEWVTRKLENNYITEVLPQEGSEPQSQAPSPGQETTR